MRISDWSSDVCSSDLPVQFLLDDLRDILLERARVGTRIGDADRQRGRRDRRILLDGKAAQRDDPGQQDADGDDPGKDGPVDEEAGRSEEHTSELQSLMRISYAVFCLQKKTTSIAR